MLDIVTIRKLAKEVLIIPLPGGEIDRSLWDRSKRLVHNVELISQKRKGSGNLGTVDTIGGVSHSHRVYQIWIFPFDGVLHKTRRNVVVDESPVVE